MIFDAAVLEELLQVMGGDLELIEDIVTTYVSETPSLVESVRTMADADSVREAAHTLMSSSRSVGAAAVGDSAESIEAAARNGALDDVAAACTAMPQLFAEACAALNHWVETQKT